MPAGIHSAAHDDQNQNHDHCNSNQTAASTAVSAVTIVVVPSTTAATGRAAEVAVERRHVLGMPYIFIYPELPAFHVDNGTDRQIILSAQIFGLMVRAVFIQTAVIRNSAQCSHWREKLSAVLRARARYSSVLFGI